MATGLSTRRQNSFKNTKKEQTEELKQFLNQFNSEIIGELLEDNVNEKLEIIEAKYTKALDDLAIFDPIRLNGRIFYFKPSLPMVVKVGGYIS